MSEKQTPDPNCMPEFKIIAAPGWLCDLGQRLFSHLRRPVFNTGGGPALDRQLYDALRETDEGIEALINMNQMYFPDEELGA